MSRKAAVAKWSAGVIVAAAAAVFVVELLEGPIFSLSTKAWPPEVHGDKVIGGIEGAVKGTDREAGTLLVASGFLGLGSLPIVVTPQTEIAVNGKLGGVADVSRGQLVRVAYEVLEDQLLATRIIVLDRAASGNLALPLESGRNASAAEPAPMAPLTPAASVTAAPPTEPAPQASSLQATTAPAAELPPRAVAPTAAARPVRQGGAVAASAPKRPAVGALAPPRIERPVTPSVAPAADAGTPPRAAPVRPADDGTAAVDWLLKGPSSQ